MTMKPNQTKKTTQAQQRKKAKETKEEKVKETKEKQKETPTPTPTKQMGQKIPPINQQGPKIKNTKASSESHPSVAEQQTTGSGKPVGDGTNAVRKNDETENDKKSQTDEQPGKDSEASDLAK